MNTVEIAEQIAYMAKTWRVEFTPGQMKIWDETLGGLIPAHARAGLRALKETAEILPSHAAFLEAYRLAEKRHRESTTAIEPTATFVQPTAEQRARNMVRVRDLKARLKAGTIGGRADLDAEF